MAELAPETIPETFQVAARRSVALPVAEIDVGPRLRAVDDDWAEAIAVSIERDGGLIHPIEVRSLPGGKHRLVVGAHRLRAYQLRGWARIEAVLFTGDALAVRAREIAENVTRRTLIRDTYGADAEEELDCIPKAGAGSFLDPGKLAACEHPDAARPELYAGGLYYLGRDVARRRDLAAIHGFELVGDVLWLRDRWVERGATFAAQDTEMDRLIASRRLVRAKIDQTGMGEKVVEDAQLRHGSTRVEGALLTGPTRLDLALAFADRVERGTLRIPPLPELRADYRAIKRKGGVSGSIQIVNADDEVHADEFWATALACSAAVAPYQPLAYRPVARGAAALDPDARLSRAGAGRFAARVGVL